MDKWNFYAFYAFGKLHKLDNMPILEAWWLYNNICVDDGIKDVYMVGYQYTLKYGLLYEIQEALESGLSIREALKEWDLL